MSDLCSPISTDPLHAGPRRHPMMPDALWSLLRGAYTVRHIPRMFLHWVDGPVGLVSVDAVIRVREMTPWMWEMRFERELAKYWREMKEQP